MFEKTHGDSDTRLYRIWKDMRRRCNNKDRTDYARYGGRGIKVCEEWNGYFVPFRDWSLSNGYNYDLSIERIDNDGDYTPDNCCWITMDEQRFNKRTSAKVTIGDKTLTVTEWSKETGLPLTTLFPRYQEGLRGEDFISSKKISFSGHHHTEDAKKRIAEKLTGEKNHNYGKVFSEETRERMSLAKKGIKPANTTEFSNEEIIEMVNMMKDKQSISAIARKFNIGRKVVGRIKRDYYEVGDKQ